MEPAPPHISVTDPAGRQNTATHSKTRRAPITHRSHFPLLNVALNGRYGSPTSHHRTGSSGLVGRTMQTNLSNQATTTPFLPANRNRAFHGSDDRPLTALSGEDGAGIYRLSTRYIDGASSYFFLNARRNVVMLENPALRHATSTVKPADNSSLARLSRRSLR